MPTPHLKKQENDVFFDSFIALPYEGRSANSRLLKAKAFCEKYLAASDRLVRANKRGGSMKLLQLMNSGSI